MSQLGHIWLTSMHSLMQQGIKQHPIQQPTKPIKNPQIHAIIAGEVLVLVLISHPQLGQTVWVECGPSGTIVVTMCCAVSIGCCGVSGWAALTPLIAENHKFYLITTTESLEAEFKLTLKVGWGSTRRGNKSVRWWVLFAHFTFVLKLFDSTVTQRKKCKKLVIRWFW